MNSIEKNLAGMLSQNWWVLLLRGLAAIAFGALTYLQPGISLAALVLLFGAYAMSDGILGVWSAIAGPRGHDSWWVMLLGGLLGIGVGILTFSAPALTTLALLFYIAIWAVSTGVLQVVAAVRLRKEVSGEWWFILAGLASVVFGILLMGQPGAGALALLSVIAAYAIFFGVLLVLLAFKARNFGKQLASV